MRNFEELLAANNIKPFFGKKHFEKRWCEVRSQYGYFCKKLDELDTLFKYINDQLKKAWGAEFSIAEVYQMPEFKFKNRKQAMEMIDQECDKVKEAHAKLYTVERMMTKKARKEWITQVISERPEKCKLIVIKSTTFVPKNQSMEQFEKAIANKSESMIAMMGISPLWVALDPNKVVDTENWLMDKMTSTVQYVS